MSRRFRVGVVSLLVFALCLAVPFAVGTSYAQVVSDGAGGASLESALGARTPFRGTGELFEEGTYQIPAEHLNVPTVAELLGLQTESVIGADGRVRVNPTTSFPSRAIAYLYVVFPNNAAGSCTGWFIGRRAVATAGHCVYSRANGGWAKTMYIYPGRNGTLAPFGYTTKMSLYSNTVWTGTENHAYDWGIVRTTAALGGTVGYFGFRWQSSNTFGAGTVRGYPGDKVGSLARTMWTMMGTIYASSTTATHSRKLWYTIDTYGGQSGSPIYQYWRNPATGTYGYYGIGIHAYGVGFPSSSYNSGTRITQSLFNTMSSVRNLDP